MTARNREALNSDTPTQTHSEKVSCPRSYSQLCPCSNKKTRLQFMPSVTSTLNGLLSLRRSRSSRKEREWSILRVTCRQTRLRFSKIASLSTNPSTMTMMLHVMITSRRQARSITKRVTLQLYMCLNTIGQWESSARTANSRLSREQPLISYRRNILSFPKEIKMSFSRINNSQTLWTAWSTPSRNVIPRVTLWSSKRSWMGWLHRLIPLRSA